MLSPQAQAVSRTEVVGPDQQGPPPSLLLVLEPCASESLTEAVQKGSFCTYCLRGRAESGEPGRAVTTFSEPNIKAQAILCLHMKAPNIIELSLLNCMKYT